MRHWAIVIVVAAIGYSSTVWGQTIQDIVFDGAIESGDTSGWWAPAMVGKTTGQDGDLQPGVAWPNPRFVDNSDGTVTDMLTGLLWLKDASCAELSGTNSNGQAEWSTALTAAKLLRSGKCGLTDNSVIGDWRLPSINELRSLIDYGYRSPPLSNTAGTGQWTEGDVFTGVPLSWYWSSTCDNISTAAAQTVSFYTLGLGATSWSTLSYVWPVRGGR